ncbi:long-chain fatty acid--CoA ligase [Porphyromonas macacae]|uniref:AMP-binding protein n=1 Tax=Porphyromonas macacae TaxID=28115 RepID=UPI00052C1141|nr:AMP-binding protein [Porphyromonas macacae]KGN99625.1 long-chain fatty acid--CoA ligase [Porphyromonas macacae]
MIETNFISIYQDSFRKNWDLKALSDYGTNKTYTYADLAKRIAEWHLIFKQIGLKPGEKVAVMGKDHAEWCVSFMSTLTYGAVVVPILQDFPAVDTEVILEHSETKVLFIDPDIWAKLNPKKVSDIIAVFNINNGNVLSEHSTTGGDSLTSYCESIRKHFEAAYPEGFSQKDVVYHFTPNEHLVLLNYTSGTTGFSKGVMITGNNLAGNILFARKYEIIKKHEVILNFLPLAHTYGCTFNFFLPLAQGSHIYLLGKIPAPSILLKAFKTIRPNLIISVPLVFERIYRDTILPKLNKPAVKALSSVPLLRKLVYKKIHKALNEGLGGNFREVIVGGAAMNEEVSRFLKKIRFKFTVGYGMTECAPLISYCSWREWRIGSCGKPLDGFMEARIDYTGYENQENGEIQVRGEHVCMGYFKKPDLTEELFTEDGWMHTGDLGCMDKDGFIYIRGRSKAMLLSANGQNIFPETIESKLNIFPLVSESLVVSRNKRLEALVVPNMDAIKAQGLTPEEGWAKIEEFRTTLNEQLGSYEKVTRFERHDEPFIKTPKQSIKRYLYTN